MKEFEVYHQHILDKANDTKYIGRMNDPTCSARIQGPCGDDMELYLVIHQNRVTEACYYTETGCAATRACGSVCAELIIGTSVDEALSVSPHGLLAQLPGLPQENRHCAILTVSTLYRALAEYLLSP